MEHGGVPALLHPKTIRSNGAWGKLGQPAQMGCVSLVIPLGGPERLFAVRGGQCQQVELREERRGAGYKGGGTLT